MDLRNYRIEIIENLTATNDQFGCIDLTNNSIIKVEKLPQLKRLTTLMLNSNQINSIDLNFNESCTNLSNLLFTNNKITNFNFIEILA